MKENGLEIKECNEELKNEKQCNLLQTKERQLKLESKDVRINL